MSDQSTFFVPYDAEKQSKSSDWSDILPRDSENGAISYVTYKGSTGDRLLGIYTPYEYDADSKEPYEFLYLVHGAGGSYEAERVVSWFTGGYVNNMFDNLTAEGLVEPTIVVSMYIQDFVFKYEDCYNELSNYIVPYMEENYNISTETSDRALLGTSMGSKMASTYYMNNSTEFGYVALFSGANLVCKGASSDAAFSANDADWLVKVDELNMPVVFTGGGHRTSICTMVTQMQPP